MSPVARIWLLFALGLALVISAVPAPTAALPLPPGNDPAKDVTIPLHGSFTAPAGWGWASTNVTNPGPALSVQQGDVITFQLFARDGPSNPHELVIDLNGNQAKDASDRNSTAFSSPTTATMFTFTASTSGTFEYFCAIHGYAAQHGTLTVQGAAATPGGDNTLLIVGGVIVVVVIAAAAAMVMRKKAKPPMQPPTQ